MPISQANQARQLLEKKESVGNQARSGLSVLIFFQVEVANELEEDVSSLQVRCDELQDELSLQVTQLTQGKGNLILLLKRGLLRITPVVLYILAYYFVLGYDMEINCAT